MFDSLSRPQATISRGTASVISRGLNASEEMSHYLTVLLLCKLQQQAVSEKLAQLKEYIRTLTTVPEELLRYIESKPENAEDFKNFIFMNDEYANFCETHSGKFVNDLQSGYQHKDIHCISFLADNDFCSIIGIPLRHFSNLFESLLPALKIAFPRSPDVLGPSDTSEICSIRFKLFLTLYRLKTASSHHLMQRIFGWNKSSLQDWHENILIVMRHQMFRFHKGFLDYMTLGWQDEEITVWRYKHLFEKKDLHTFVDRIKRINSDSQQKGLAPRINLEEVHGSIGAYDATYSLRPRILPSTLERNGEDPSADRLYSDYIGAHAYKLLIATSHGINGRPKFIFYVKYGPGSCHDNPLLVGALAEMKSKLSKLAFGLGDHAFHGCFGVVVPYTHFDMRGPNAALFGAFNHSHSSDRMTSEHGVMFMKLWGVVRGRSDQRLYEKEDLYYSAIDVCWALHNYKALDGPLFTCTI